MINDDFEGDFNDASLDQFDTYEAYLDSHITDDDRFYLQDEELARQLKEQGYHPKAQILSRQMFYKKKKEIEEARRDANKDKTKALSYIDVDQEKLKKDPFLWALAKREEDVLNGSMLTIIFIRYETQKSQISGYIDFAHRLKTQDFKPYFEGKQKLLPRPTDLSYYNWRTGFCNSNDSPNFKVDANSGQQGLLFRNKRDRKVINVDPKKKLEENMVREEIITNAIKDEKDLKDSKELQDNQQYAQIVLYDHKTRRKNN